MPIKNHHKTLADLVAVLSAQYQQLADNEQYWLAIAGAPGSGKSTLADALKVALNDALNDSAGDKLTVIPMDGYHYSRHELDQMDDPVLAHQRRGAPFTFNAPQLVADLRAARRAGTGVFPSFDHREGDPKADDIVLKAGKQIVIVEGNYLLLNEAPWDALKREVFDESWLLYVPLAECQRRLVSRHMSEMGMTEAAANARFLSNDGPNAERVYQASLASADLIFEPID